MQIDKIKLKNFRNHLNKEFSFDNKLTLLTGPNGSGKTNILEAIYVLATGRSQRARYDKDLINYDHKYCSLYAEVFNQQDAYKLELQVIRQDDASNYSAKKAKVNKVVKSISGFTGIFNAVLFVPEDISIITGAPAERRRFLDLILSQAERGYKRDLSSYVKAVRQRNKILELINEEGRGYSQLDFWNGQIRAHGSLLQEKRREFFEFVSKNLQSLVTTLEHSREKVEVFYKESKITDERLEKYRDKEIAAKSTLIGPHREDFEITLDGYDVGEFGSRGQQRTIILILKLIEIGFIEKTKGERPVLLLDDIFSELDENHRQAVIEIIGKQQTIITSAESERVLGVDIGKVIKI